MKTFLPGCKAYLVMLCMLISSLSFAQNISVTGRVLSAAKTPLSGATVSVKGTAASATTDAEGRFAINVTNQNATLVVSFVGFASQEIPLAGKTDISISLVEAAGSLDDVVVIGYAAVKRSDVTGAVATIGQKEIRSRPVANAMQAMQGKVAGVDIGSNERPGTLPTINIRGVRSLTASNSPLFVLDGIPLMTGSIDNINPNDIESIDVLKDASATAIYGSRGANGVIIITTKQGKRGKTVLTFINAVTIENIVDNQKMFNADEYITFRRWAYYYAGLNPTTGVSTFPRGDQPDIARDRAYFGATSDPFAWANIAKGWASGTWDGSKVATTDWRSIVKQQSITSDNIISASGGTDKIKAYGSFGYLNNKGTIKGQSFERYTAKTNVDISATKWLTLGSNLNINYNSQQFGQSNLGVSTVGTPQGGLYESARGIFPFAVPFDSAGNRILFPGGDNAIKNVVDEWKYNIDERVTLRAFGSIYTQVDFGELIPALKGFRYRVNFGPDMSFTRRGVFIDANSVANGGSSSFASLQKDNTFSYTLDNLLYYDKAVGEHTFGLTLLHSQTGYRQELSNITGNGVPLSSSLWNALTSGTVTGSLSSASHLIDQQILSYMARLNYGYKEKYLLTVSARQDGSSVLAEGKKYSLFPSAALAWRMNKENFIKADWINDLKLRIGAGVTGNSAIAPYATQGAVTALFYPFNNASAAGSIPNPILANQALGWEKTTQYNLGVDYAILKNRISGSIDVYTSSTTDLLLQRSIPTVTGFTTTFANIGETANKGIDININTVNIRTQNFTWNTTLNAAWQKDRIVNLANGKQNDISNNWFIDQPVGVIYGYKSAGLWQTNDKDAMQAFNANGHRFTPGSVRVADLNGDNRIDPNNDRQIIGWTSPRWVVGMTNTFNYKQLDLAIFLYGRLRYMYNTGGEGQAARTVTRAIDYYTENNTTAYYQKPIFNAGGAAGDPYFATLGYMDASFIKIRNISLGYTMQGKGLERMGLSGFRAYLQVANPGMLFSNIKFLDMDVVGPTWNRGVTLGINTSF